MSALSQRKPKVLFEQYVIPHYRIAFFTELAKHVDLTVVASIDRAVDGLRDTRNDLPFRNVRLAEADGTTLHPDIQQLLIKEHFDVYISWQGVFQTILQDPSWLEILKKHNIKTIWMGCDGYRIRNFLLTSLKQLAPWRMKASWKDYQAVSRVDGFVAHSSHMLDYLHKVRLVPKKKITLTHNAVDHTELSQACNALRAGGAQRDKYHIIYTGRLSPQKKVDVLLCAYKNILPEFPQTHLTIIGEGSQLEVLKNLAQRFAIEPHVTFTGGVYSDKDLATHLSTAGIFVMPGLGGLGLNTAMAAGLPIIYTHADGTEEDLMRENVNGWFFDGSVDGLTRVLTSSLNQADSFEQMGLASKERITKEFHIPQMVEGYLDRISKVLHV